MSFVAFALWGAFMMGSIFYTQEARHPEAKPLAAYLTFVAVFSTVAFVTFGALTLLLEGIGRAEILSNPGAAIAFLLAVFLPAFLLARWQLRKPPRSRHLSERF